MTEQVESRTTGAAPVGDLGRRIVRRREELGLSREETATRAGMGLSYLRHLEEYPAATPGRGALHVLAEVPAQHRQGAHRRGHRSAARHRTA